MNFSSRGAARQFAARSLSLPTCSTIYSQSVIEIGLRPVCVVSMAANHVNVDLVSICESLDLPPLSLIQFYAPKSPVRIVIG